MNLVELKENQGLRRADQRWYSRTAKWLLFITDIFLLNLVCLIVNYFFAASPSVSQEYSSVLSTHVVLSLNWIGVALFINIYHIDGLTKNKRVFWDLFGTFILHLLLTGIFYSLNSFPWSLQGLGFYYLLSMALVISIRFLSISLYKKYKSSPENIRNVVIIGARPANNSLYQFFIEHSELGYRFKGFFDDDPSPEFSMNQLVQGNLKAFKEFCLKEQIDEIYYALSLENKQLINELADFADEHFIYFRIVPDFKGLVKGCLNLYFYDNIPILTPRQEPLRILINRVIKRGFDVAFSLFVILTIFPFIFPVIALIIKLESKGDVFFKQKRPGFKNQLFWCYKFRTMKNNTTTEKQAVKNDPRITKFGKFLRKTSLDELPQFFNVLKGDMSVVGPRPNMIKQLEFYSQSIDKYAVRHFIKPGITGYAQVSGYRGETQDVYLMEKRVEYDLKYIENWSLALDCKIILWTVLNIFKGEEKAY